VSAYPIDLLRKKVLRLERKLHWQRRNDKPKDVQKETRRSLRIAWETLAQEERERYRRRGI